MIMLKDREPPSTFQRVLGIAKHQGLRRLVIQSRNYIVGRILGRMRIRQALPNFRREASQIDSLDGALDFAYSWKSGGLAIRPFQNKDEIAAFFKIVGRERPRTVVEIGTGWGGTLFLFAETSSPDAIIVSIDLPPKLMGRGYPRWRDELYRSFAKDDQKICLVRGDSHNSSTLEAVRNAIGERLADILFIDGDHTYEGVKRDFDLYSPLIRKGGLIALHDITPNLIDDEVDVPKFWNEIKRNWEVVTEIKIQGDYAGIGIIRL